LIKEKIKKLRLLYLKSQSIIFLGGIAAIVATNYIGLPFLMWWLKDGVVVESAYPVLKILAFYFALISLTPLPTVLVQSMGKPQIASFFAVMTIVLDLLGLFVLVPMYSSVGAAYAFLFGALITVPPFLIYSLHLLNVKIYDYK
jgi:O-antigen/teichoic acid export membrane protein